MVKGCNRREKKGKEREREKTTEIRGNEEKIIGN